MFHSKFRYEQFVPIITYLLFNISSLQQITNLLSDQGGQVGLWLGLSMLTMFEMVELLWDLVSSVFYVSKKTAPASTESKEPPAENLTS